MALSFQSVFRSVAVALTVFTVRITGAFSSCTDEHIME